MDVRDHLEKSLEKNGERWLLYDNRWIEMWEKGDEEYQLVIGKENSGFIFLKKNHIIFAFVPKECRRKGKLKLMFRYLLGIINYSVITLSSLTEESDKVWEKLGFICIKKGDDKTCGEYVYDI